LKEEVAKVLFNLYNCHFDDFNYNNFNALKLVIQESSSSRKILKERGVIKN